MSQSSLQLEGKKPKRRAPPPPIPKRPNRFEEIHNKRQSTIVTENIRYDSKGASSPLLQKAENPSSHLPVKIIDEVPENYTIARSNSERKTGESDLVTFFERKMNIESVNKDCVRISPYLPKNFLPKVSRKNTYENISDELNKSHLELKGASAKHSDEEKSDPTQFPWCGNISNKSKIYRSKTGLTTFTVVPPKPKIRDFKRNQSLYSDGIQIDHLGNLVKPNYDCARKIIVDETSKVTGFERGKEYKRSNSIEKQTEGLSSDDSVEGENSIKSKQPNKMFSTKPDCIRSLTIETWPTVTSSNENIIGPDVTKVLSNTSQFSEETVLAFAITKRNFMLQMPSKQSSNDYLTITVANSNDITQFEIIQEKQYEELNKTEGMKTEMEPVSKRCTVAAKYYPVEIEPAKTKELYSTTSSCSKNVSNTTLLCADPRLSNIKELKQNEPTNTICGRITVTSGNTKLSEQKLVYNLVQDVTDKEMTFAVVKKPSDQVSSPFFLSKPNDDSSATIFNSHVKSSDIPSTAMVNQITEKYENPGKAESKLCPNRLEDNVYDIFQPKEKCKSVIQKLCPNDIPLHCALMEANQDAGEDKLQKISSSTISGSLKESKCIEMETGHSALLAAIRGHSGNSTLRKRLNKSRSSEEQLYGPSPPPPLPLSLAQMKTEKGHSHPRKKDSPERTLMMALKEAISSGARLRKFNKKYL